MVADENLDKLKNALETILNDFLKRRLPLRRIAFLSTMLRLAGVESDLYDTVIKRILSEQKEDGGWIDCEDTIWNTYLLSFYNTFFQKIQLAIKWLENERPANNGWGFCKRDNPNIPLTSQAMFFIPELRYSSAFEWLEKEWGKDLKSPINLNYKGACFLLIASQRDNSNSELINETIDYLIQEQREDGGWGPWKKHPAATDPYITGLCCLSLSYLFRITEVKEIPVILKKSINWFEKNQLENGLYATHYIEEGSAWCYVGWNEALKCMS